MQLWCIPEDGSDKVPDSVYRTEWVILAASAEEATNLLRTDQEVRLREYYADRWADYDYALYDKVGPIEGRVYNVPMYGYSW